MTASVVALGGGHGLYSSLTALRSLTHDLTAIVTVADDGGSSGRLRDEMGIVPPGDLRMALAALCEDTEWGRTWRDILQMRFETDGPLDGHAVGNLLIAAAWTHTGDVVEGLDWIGRLLRSEGRVLPLAEEPLEISAVTRDAHGSQTVRGQVAVATAPGTVASLALSPQAPKVPQATLDAIARADMVVLGPGSWYTSVLTHFLVEPVARALTEAGPRCVVVLNIAHEDQETAGTDRIDDIRALRAVAADFTPAVVLAHSDDARGGALVDCVADWGARLMVAPMLEPGTRDRHDRGALAVQLELASESIIRGTRGPRSMAG